MILYTENKVPSWKEFISILMTINGSEKYFWRGQKNASWKIEPSIMRWLNERLRCNLIIAGFFRGWRRFSAKPTFPWIPGSSSKACFFLIVLATSWLQMIGFRFPSRYPLTAQAAKHRNPSFRSPKTDYRFFSQKGLAFMSAGDKLRTAFVLTNSFLTE